MVRPPWRESGRSAREAAAHLLDRCAFGPRPGEVDAVAARGPEAWLEEQFAGGLASPRLERFLDRARTLDLDGATIVATYPTLGEVRRAAIRHGVLPEDVDDDPTLYRSTLREFMRRRGQRPQRELFAEILAAKLLRVLLDENQLREVLVDFWSDHLYVSGADPRARRLVGTYERDVIRPHVLGRFGDMLRASARHPAMLLYLDNAGSGRESPNENYARELLELHTVGVDGGYTEDDVRDVARAFTGWTVLPFGEERDDVRARANGRRARMAGAVVDDDFLFRPDRHDTGAKTVLGRALPAGRGIEDGEDVLDHLSTHPSTARFVSGKLARRLVHDDPPESLVAAMARAWERTGGDLAAVTRTLLESSEFWDPTVRGAKIKSPLELVASAVRATGATVVRPRPLHEWTARMGQPLYRYPAPTGFPDHADAWVNAGSLLQRMKFGLDLAAGAIEGVHVDLLALNEGREPADLRDALRSYGERLLPARDLSAALDALERVARDPELGAKIDERTPASTEVPGGVPGLDPSDDDGDDAEPLADDPGADPAPAPAALARAVGVLLGSPEFQRH
jgi:uncharacterized protein (DUF1800 family)